MSASHATTLLFLLFCNLSSSQTYYGVSHHQPTVGFWLGHTELHKLTIANGTCTEQNLGIVLGAPTDSVSVGHMCHCPDNFLYADVWNDSTNIYKIDPQTAQVVGVIPMTPPQGNLSGMVCKSNGIIQAIATRSTGSKFVEINPATGALSVLSSSSEMLYGDLVQYDGVWYTDYFDGIRRLDFAGSNFSTELLYDPFSGPYGFDLTVFPSGPCNSLLSTQYNGQGIDLYLTHLDQHTSTLLCTSPFFFYYLTMVGGDYDDPDPDCTVPIDLDRNDNSGATGNDYNSAIFSCKVNNVKIVDNDVFIPAYPIIDTMRVSITAGLLDTGKEGFYVGSLPAGIAASGNTTSTIVFTNASGTARVSDFLDALKLIQYKDVALSPLGGVREITVSFVTRQGFPTEKAKCFVQVQEFPSVPVDLGPDTYFCQGSSATLNAGNPGLTYYWSGGQTTQTINAMLQGTYKVTVSDGINCPGADEVYVKKLPVANATITGPVYSCAGDSVALVFNCNCTGSFDLIFSNNLAQDDTLYNVTDGSSFKVFLPVNPNGTLYDLNYHFEQANTGASNSCLHFQDQTITLLVNPLITMVYHDAFICQGDSINIDGVWQSQPGVYTNYTTNIFGCDVAVNTTLYVTTPGNQTFNLNETTCDPTLAGVFTNELQSFNGCDSTIVTTIAYTPSDTIYLASQTCDPTLAGVFTQNLTNQAGCDSVIVTTISLGPSIPVGFDQPASICQGDSAAIVIYILGPGSFDLSMTNINTGQMDLLTGISSSYTYYASPTQTALYLPQQIIGPNTTACLDINNSLILNVSPIGFSQNSVVLCAGDSLFLENAWQTTSGTYTDTLDTQFGCDSIVTTNVLFLLSSDTVFLASQTCDPMLAGIFTQNLTNGNGCDSTIVTTITLSPSDTVYLASQTCDPLLAGIFTQNLTNGSGCDSTVVTTVTLLLSNTIFLASQTCDPAQAGVFTQNLTNGSGCDSTVITTVTLLDSDTVLLSSQTCDPTQAGIFTQNLTNWQGCDSTVVTTVSLQPNDMVFLSSETCDPALAGTSMAFLTNQYGCDSVVVSTVALLPSDTSYMALEGCDPALVGVFTAILTNQNGCDSVVVSSYSLIPSDTTLLSGFTCEPSETGIFEQTLANANGCDSIVFLTVSLLPKDSCETTIPTMPEEGWMVYAPNAFSPNGDGINDLFQLYTNAEVKLIRSLQVYSRWGERVFEAYDLAPNDPNGGWDGFFREKLMDAGVYVFWANVESMDGALEIVRGEVLLVK